MKTFIITMSVLSIVVCFYAAYGLVKMMDCRRMSDEKLLMLPYESLESWAKEDLLWLLDYSFQKGTSESNGTLRQKWMELYRKVDMALCRNHYW